ncbi:sigma factor-like helix-turn-helix DNA-binding protein [Rhizobium sp. SL86]|uniref:sigma factor-like helix-turn-helix DNA-binding protein n=1 Tax=Rhizobium sp. SL86 TaxID=2995148 RepID=UPI0022731710|nr:sigma factor-like helix-turn-helix DNA-binding protein [Rhizobium sp. SL86]MCY1669320.1 winged helix-turn-helix transcriptional regulator [Rhizobium sp. SL86]
MPEDLTQELKDTLGDDGFFRLVEVHAGVRLYIPSDPDRSELPAAIGADAAVRLSKMFPGGYIRVPLAREFRAVRYHKAGATNREIAKRLGLTEGGVDRLLKRARAKKLVERKTRKDPRQIEMF